MGPKEEEGRGRASDPGWTRRRQNEVVMTNQSPSGLPDHFQSPGVAEVMTAPFSQSASVTELRERVELGGLELLSETETLELLLSRSIPRGAHGVAIQLLRRFGSLRAVLAAERSCLAKFVEPSVAIDLQLIFEATRRLAWSELPRRTLLSSWSALFAYLKLTMSHCEREAFRVLFLDTKNQLIADEILGRGTVDHAPVYPREVMRRALELSASHLILVHNHPSGDPTPSSADVEMTRQIIAAGKALRIVVHDHVIVGRDDVASLKALGLL
jgi:DNA repair protein RadC